MYNALEHRKDRTGLAIDALRYIRRQTNSVDLAEIWLAWPNKVGKTVLPPLKDHQGPQIAQLIGSTSYFHCITRACVCNRPHHE
jgi:hypothetical protein